MNLNRLAFLAAAALMGVAAPSISIAQDAAARNLILRSGNTTAANVGTLSVTTLTAPRSYAFPDKDGTILVTPAAMSPLSVLRTNALGDIETVALTDGQLLIGATGGLPTAATLTGTTNQVTVTNGTNSITLSLPQDIHTGASPTFLGLSITDGPISLTTTGANDITITPAGELKLVGITALSPITDLLWIDASNNVRRAPFTGTANEGVEFQSSAYRLGGQTTTTNPLTSNRYVNIDDNTLTFTAAAGAQSPLVLTSDGTNTSVSITAYGTGDIDIDAADQLTIDAPDVFVNASDVLTLFGNTAAFTTGGGDITINLPATGDLVLNGAVTDNTVLTYLGITAGNEVREVSLDATVWRVGGNTFTAAGTYTVGTNSAHDFALESGGTTRLTLANGSPLGTAAMSIEPSADNTYDLGSDDNRWANAYINGASLHIGPTGGQAGGTELAIGYAASNATINVDGGTTELTVAAGSATVGGTLTINSAGGANLTIDENTISRSGNIFINPGSGNTLSTDGSLNVLVSLDVTSNTMLNGSLTAGNGNDNVSINAGTGTFQLVSTGLNVNTSGDISNTAAAVVVDDAQGLNVKQGGVDIDAGGLNVDAGGATIVGATSINTTAAANTITIGNNTAGNTVTVNSPSVTLANLPAGTGDVFVMSNAGALETRTISNIVTGTGTNGRLTRWGASNTLQDASLDDDGSGVLSRTGNIQLNPGSGNTVSTDGSLTVAVTTTLNGAVNAGNGDDNVNINAGTGTFQLSSTGLNVNTSGDISSAAGAVVVDDANGLNVKQGGVDIDAGGLNVDAGGATIVGTTSINTTAAANTTTIGNNTAGNTLAVNAPVVTMANLPAAAATANVFIVEEAGEIRKRTITGSVLSGTGTDGRMTRWGAGNTLQDASLDDNGSGVLSRAGTIAINPGTGNDITTDGGITSAENVTITAGGLTVTAGTTTMNDDVALGSSNTDLATTNARMLFNAGVRVPALVNATGVVNVDDSHYVIIQTAAADINLPATTGNEGRIILVKNMNAAAININAAGTDTVEGAAALNLATGASVTLVASGNTWYQVGN